MATNKGNKASKHAGKSRAPRRGPKPVRPLPLPLVAGVAKEIMQYVEVQRREEGFDLSPGPRKSGHEYDCLATESLRRRPTGKRRSQSTRRPKQHTQDGSRRRQRSQSAETETRIAKGVNKQIRRHVAEEFHEQNQALEDRPHGLGGVWRSWGRSQNWTFGQLLTMQDKMYHTHAQEKAAMWAEQKRLSKDFKALHLRAKKRSKDDPEVIVEGVGTDKLLEITSKIVVQATHDLATVIGMDPEGSSQRRVATMREEGLHSSRQSPEPNNDAASHEASSSSDLGQRP
eukprot:m.228827 g.228827  ORF g.228827 m.228827 type:complete len:286 (-) comp18833_c0_seq5:1717-2574(-)